MKYILFTIFLIISTTTAYANDYIGAFSTHPETMPGFNKPYSEEVKRAIDVLTWKMTISKKEIKIWIRRDGEPIVMSYKVDGKYILATEDDESEDKYYIPFYLENPDRIHGFNAIFSRIKDNK